MTSQIRRLERQTDHPRGNKTGGSMRSPKYCHIIKSRSLEGVEDVEVSAVALEISQVKDVSICIH